MMAMFPMRFDSFCLAALLACSSQAPLHWTRSPKVTASACLAFVLDPSHRHGDRGWLSATALALLVWINSHRLVSFAFTNLLWFGRERKAGRFFRGEP